MPLITAVGRDVHQYLQQPSHLEPLRVQPNNAKRQRYVPLSMCYHFEPLAVETVEVLGPAFPKIL